MVQDDKIKGNNDWRSKGFDQYGSRSLSNQPKQAEYIGGANFDVLLDELLFNRMIKLKDLRSAPQGNDPGKIYWDGENKKFKIWVGDGKWADVNYTSTSTSSTSSSSSSTSTSSTSSSSTSSTSISTTSSSSSSSSSTI